MQDKRTSGTPYAPKGQRSGEESIQLSNSYFVPDELAARALAVAARRGVKVQVIVPGPPIDTEVVRRASRSLWGSLLEAGVQIAEYIVERAAALLRTQL